MIIAVTIVHVIVCIGLILVVLLQTGKGAEVGAVFGGSSATIFGSSGAGNFLSKLTTGMAIVFMMTSLTLGYFADRKPSGSIFDSHTGTTAPAAPAAPTIDKEAAPPAGTKPAAPEAKTPPAAPETKAATESKAPAETKKP